ncbi:MAG: protein kinase [Cyanobacteriota bacterium]
MALNPVDPFQSAHLEKPLGGRYKLINHLGEGGFGQTFLAEDLHLPGHPRCVVKQLKPQLKDSESLQTARRLFDMEAKVLYQLGNHEQIPRLLAHFEDGQEFYLAQEFIAGETLTQEVVEGQPWSEANVVALTQDILQVLTFVHQQNVIHRDIKPANLIRRQQDGKIVLIDFGAVKQVSTQLLNSKTGKIQTIAIGTQGYIPNEQLAGNPRFSSDVYAVGMMGIQALTGMSPTYLGIDRQTGEIDWRDRATHVSPELAAVLDHMVRYDFRTRYPTALEALEALQSLPTVATAPSLLPQLACIPKAPEGVTLTRHHHSSQPNSSVSVSEAVEEVTVTRLHRASPSVPQIIPATLPATQAGKTLAVAPGLKKRSSNWFWLPGLGGAIATIAAMSLGTALLKAQQGISLPHESQNSTASSEPKSPPKATSSELKSPALIQTPLPQPSTSSAPSDKPTTTPTTSKVPQPIRVVSPPQPHPVPMGAPASNPSQTIRVASPPQPHPAPMGAPASNPSRTIRVASPPQPHPAPMGAPASNPSLPVEVIRPPQPHPVPIAPSASNPSQPVGVISQPQPHPQVTGNEPTLNQEALTEQEPPTKAVGHQAKEAAKQREREEKEVSKQQEQEQEAKKAASKLGKGKH